MKSTKIAVFKGRQTRKTLYNNKWWFAIEDVVLALTDSNDPRQYIQKMRKRDPQLSEGWVQFVHPLLKNGFWNMNFRTSRGFYGR